MLLQIVAGSILAQLIVIAGVLTYQQIRAATNARAPVTPAPVADPSLLPSDSSTIEAAYLRGKREGSEKERDLSFRMLAVLLARMHRTSLYSDADARAYTIKFIGSHLKIWGMTYDAVSGELVPCPPEQVIDADKMRDIIDGSREIDAQRAGASRK